MTPEQQNAVSIAVIQTEVTHLKAGVADLKTTNAQQNAKLDRLIRTMDEARGGWKTLLLMGGAAGMAGSGLSWLITHWKA